MITLSSCKSSSLIFIFWFTILSVACGNQIHVWDNSIERDDVHTGESALSCIEITPDEKGKTFGNMHYVRIYNPINLPVGAGCGLSPG